MKIAVGNPDDHIHYIHHARTETLRSLGLEPNPALTAPVAHSQYVFAYEDSTGNPIGMGESAMLADIYPSYREIPYSSVTDLSAFCPLREMAGMRTVYVDPKFRNRSSLFLALTLGSAKLFLTKGARFSTATTCANDDYLNRMYEKFSGIRVGTFRIESMSALSSLFVFDLWKLLQHSAMRRIEPYLELE